jgi:hypothetical protein
MKQKEPNKRSCFGKQFSLSLESEKGPKEGTSFGKHFSLSKESEKGLSKIDL